MSFFSQLFGGGRPDNTQQVRAALSAGARIVDVRSEHEFAGQHVPGAINIPHTDIGNQLAKVGRKDVPVIVYCRSGGRSASAARVLSSNGYTQVIDVGAMSNFPMGALET